MTDYAFEPGKSEHSEYANFDQIGGAITIYMGEFLDPIPDIKAYNLEEIQMALYKAVLVHEHWHAAIAECVDTDGEQEHATVFEWLDNWLVKESD